MSQQKAEAFTLLLETVGSIREIEDDEAIVDRCLKTFCQLGKWDIGQSWFPDVLEGTLVCHDQQVGANLSSDSFTQKSLKTSFRIGEGLPGRVWKDCAPLWISNVCEDVNFPRVLSARQDGITTAFAFPIKRKDSCLGVLEFFSQAPRTVSKPLLGAAEMLGTYLGLVLELRHVKTAVLEAAAPYKDLFDSSHQFMAHLKTDGSIIDINNTAESALGVESSSLVGLKFYEAPWWNSQETKDMVKQAVLEAANGQITRRELEFFDAQHRWSVGVLFLRPVIDAYGKIVYLLAEGFDVTELQLHQQELSQLAVKLAQSNVELTHFASVAAHELQEPLRTIGTFSKYLSEECRGQCGKNAHEFLEMIIDAGSRMRELVNDLLAYAQIDADGQALEPIDAAKCVEEVIATLDKTIKDNQACVLYGSLPYVMSGHVQLTEVFQNLLSNAIKFRRADSPCIEIAAEHKGSYWLFSVKDNGIGIDMVYKDTIFEMFRRLHPQTKYSGTGIGLAICKKIVECSGGQIWVESELDMGSTFFFTLPALDTRSQYCCSPV
ncbi:MAG: GAF domain-containing protein [Candidatus Melainabacteria bacterium]|nr:GAF domain-containing protein [Candidatus Melainabacteria bacterium]